MKTVLKISLSSEEQSLVQMAENVIGSAYAPFTEVQVGSAVLTERKSIGVATSRARFQVLVSARRETLLTTLYSMKAMT